MYIKMPSSNASPYFIWLYIRNLLVIRYRGAFLGLIWNILQPLLYLTVLGFVFATFNQAPLDQYVLYLFAGLIPWRFFEQASMSMMESILQNGFITKKIHTPSIYFPLTQLGIAFADFLCAFVVLLGLFLVFQAEWHVQMVILPLSILIWLLLAAGTGITLAVLFVFFQDLKNIVQMILMLFLFTSTIFFKKEMFVSDPLKMEFLRFDPVCYWVSLFQKPIFYGEWPSGLDWSVGLLSSVFLLGLGLVLYRNLHHRFYYSM